MALNTSEWSAERVAAVTGAQWFADVFALTKPRLSLLVLLTAAGGLGLAPVAPALVPAVVSVLAIALLVGGANALNCYLERESDALMTRTRARPLPAGRLSANTGLAFGLIAAVVSLATLVWSANLLTAVLGAIAFVSYVALYTPLKRVTPLAMVVGAIPGAIPPLMGWTAATNELSAPAWALFSILFFWQLPHFLGIAVMQRSEYARAGIATFPGAYGERVTVVVAVIAALGMFGAGLVPVALGMAGTLYGVGAAILGGIGVWVASTRTGDLRPWARRMFLFSLLHLAALFAVLTVDGILARF